MGVYRLTKQVQLYSLTTITKSGFLDVNDLVMICDKPRLLDHDVMPTLSANNVVVKQRSVGITTLLAEELAKQKPKRVTNIFIKVVGMTKETIGYVLFDNYSYNAFEFVKPC